MRDGDPSVWVLHDGKAGDRLQCEAVARLLSDTFETRIVKPRRLYQWLMPYGPVDPTDPVLALGTLPHIIIASGRRAVAYGRYFKRRFPATFVCFLKDPRTSYRHFDLVWIPEHDHPKLRSNVFTTMMAPHRFNEATLNEIKTSNYPQIDALREPVLGVILGGTTRTVRYDQSTIEAFCAGFSSLPPFASVAVTHSRRTPKPLLDAVKARFAGLPHFIDSGNEAENPYPHILAKSDLLVVRGDSHNMVSEAASATKPLFVFNPAGNSKKLDLFNRTLVKTGVCQKFPPSVPPSGPQSDRQSRQTDPRPELNVAQLIADQINQRLNANTSG